MSAGLMCLVCRKYVDTPEQPVHAEMRCRCLVPVPSWDGREPAREGTLVDGLRQAFQRALQGRYGR